MNKNVKKICAGILSLCLLVSATGALAAEWKKVGYDLSTAPNFEVKYQQFDENGLYTGLSVQGADAEHYGLTGYAKSVEWKDTVVDKTYTCANPGQDHNAVDCKVCGNRELGRLYLDGIAQSYYAPTGVMADVEERWVNSYWEKSAPYKIYQKKEVNLPGEGWYTDATYPTRYSGVNEIVTVTADQVYVDINDVIGWANTPVVELGNSNNIHNFCYEKAYLENRAIDATGFEHMFDNVRKLYQRRLVGSSIPVEVVDDTTFTYGLYSTDVVAEAKWVPAGYEAAYPYRYYEVLSLDGYVMDGGSITIHGDTVSDSPDLVEVRVDKPYIYRYTGACANLGY